MLKKLVGATLSLALVAGSVQAADKMRISLQLPLKSHLGQNLLVFEKEVEARTKGAIDVEIYDSAQLYKDKEVPAAVGSGAIEAGVASLTRYVGDAPVVDVFYMPFLLNSEAKVRAAVAEGSVVRTTIEKEVAKTGGEILYWQAYGGAILLSKGGPIRTPADMKGKKARVFGKTLGDFVKAAGGAPTLISGSEQYLAYQRGTVDIGMTGVSGVKSRKLWEVMDTITVTNHADIEFVVVVNTKWWNSLQRIPGDISVTRLRLLRKMCVMPCLRSRPMLMPPPRPMECKSWSFPKKSWMLGRLYLSRCMTLILRLPVT